jgi:hypothetical protein
MSRLEVFAANDRLERQKWIGFLSDWPEASFSSYPSYLELFSGPEETRLLLTLSGTHGQMMLPVVLRAIPGEADCVDALGPYGYGSACWRGDPGIREQFWNEVRSWAADQHIVSIVARLPVLETAGADWPFARSPVKRNVVRAIVPWDSMWMDFEHKVRKNYKRAEGAGLSFRITSGMSALAEFLPVYTETMRRNNAPPRFLLSERQLQKLGQELGDRCMVGIASLTKDVVAAELCLVDSATLYSFLGGTRSEFFNLRPNDFLKCEIMKWAAGNGFANFVLGGGLGGEDGIFRYKKSFAPHGDVIFEVGEWIIDPFNYSRILKRRAEEEHGWKPSPDFYPVYRA